MKTMRPNLTIQLNRSRNNSTLDKNNTQSGFLTPIDQTISTPVYPPPNPQFASFFQQQQAALQQSKQQQQQSQQELADVDVCTPTVESRDSTFSLYSDDEVMGETPQAYQAPPSFLQQQQQYPQQPELTRSSSIASSFAGDSILPSVNFTKTFDNLLLSVYQTYVNKPDITPFDPKYPPSGLASRVSRDVLKQSINDKINIDYNLKKNEELCMKNNFSYALTAIRKRLIELCDPNPYHHTSSSIDESAISMDNVNMELPPFLSRQSSFVAQHQIQRQNSTASNQSFSITNGINGSSAAQQQAPQQHKPSWLHLNSSFMTHRLSSTDSLVENANFNNQHHQSQSQSQSQSQQQQNVSRSNSIGASGLNKLYNTPPSLSRWTSNDTDFEIPITKKDFSANNNNAISQQTLFYPPQFPNSTNIGNNVTPPQQHIPQLEDINTTSIHHSTHPLQHQQTISTNTSTSTITNTTGPQQQQLHTQSYQSLESPFHPTFNLAGANFSPISGGPGSNQLQSPFCETAPQNRHKSEDSTNNPDVAIDPLYNATHNRKRDSLIKKRGGR